MAAYSSAIGSFVIGLSPIEGTAVAGTETLLAQYANSPVIRKLIEDFAEAVDPTANIQRFYDLLWNVATAVGYGLDVWGRIVGVDRVLAVPQGVHFGFEEAVGPGIDTFGFGIYYSGGGVTTNYALSDDAFRLLIFAKAAANLWDGSIPGLNNILRLLFPGQVAYCTDLGGMAMTYTFAFPLTPVQAAVIANSGVLPRPCGVSTSVVLI